MSNDGTGMTPPPSSEPAGAVTSQEVARKNPSQGRLKPNFGPRPPVKVDRNRHGIRRETIPGAKKTKPKKV